MALEFPTNQTPHFITIKLPDYVKNQQQFDTSDFYQINYQTNQIGYGVDCRYTMIDKANSDIIVSFYNSVKHDIFTLPSDFFSKFPSTFINGLNLYTFWEFSSTIKLEPRIINNSTFLTDCSFSLTNCLS